MTYRALDVTATLERLGITDLVPSKVTYGAAQPIFVACSGPLAVSSCKELAVDYPMVWDVNGYYRDLGIAAPYRPTRKDLRQAYQARGGAEDVRMTYVLKQLLDDELRHRYDRMPLGSVFDDEYEWAKLDKISSQWASDQTAETGEVHTVEDFHRAHGMVPGVSTRTQTPYGVGHLSAKWPFAFYLWNSRRFDDDTLSRWQKLIIDEAWKRGLHLRFAVGYVGSTAERWVHLIQPDGVQIFFLSDVVTPSCHDAEEALDALAPRHSQHP